MGQPSTLGTWTVLSVSLPYWSIKYCQASVEEAVSSIQPAVLSLAFISITALQAGSPLSLLGASVASRMSHLGYQSLDSLPVIIIASQGWSGREWSSRLSWQTLMYLVPSSVVPPLHRTMPGTNFLSAFLFSLILETMISVLSLKTYPTEYHLGFLSFILILLICMLYKQPIKLKKWSKGLGCNLALCAPAYLH